MIPADNEDNLQSFVTWSVVSTETARRGDVCVTMAGMETRAGCRHVTPGALNTVSVTRDTWQVCDDAVLQECAATERVSAQTAGMASTAPWRAAPVTAGVTVRAPCPTTSSAGSVCARAAGMGPAATSGLSRTATTG